MIPEIVSKTTKTKQKLKKSYTASREEFDKAAIELNRNKVLMLDEHGRIVKCNLWAEH
jgi:ABC-type phosphate transport system auxiliary subunit